MTNTRADILKLVELHIQGIEQKRDNGDYIDEPRWKDSIENQRLMLILLKSLVETQDNVIEMERNCQTQNLPLIYKRLDEIDMILRTNQKNKTRFTDKYLYPLLVFLSGAGMLALVEHFMKHNV